MNNKSLELSTVKSMTSLEIAELTGKRHSDVKRDTQVMCKELEIDVSKFAHVSLNRQNQEVTYYVLDSQLTLVLVTGYSVKMRQAIIDRWQELEAINAKALHQEAQRVAARYKARMDCPLMTNALKEHRERQGKATEFYHYSNELDMINRLVLGVSAKQFRLSNEILTTEATRDYMSATQIKGIETLQTLNSSLVEVGITFKERKKLLQSRWLTLSKTLLLKYK